ncbi:MAG: tRNA lysidine(34) synthetase TilS [Microscillaceae bacterium]|nr:tRNA lysidine(34) synthetase TilS [Microscillaceae bacterium]
MSPLAAKYGFSYRQSREIWQNRAGQAGQLFQSQKYDLYKDRHEWAIALRLPLEKLSALQIQETDREVCTPHFCLQTEVRPQSSPLSWPEDAWTALLDFDQLRFPLTLRLWQAGDYFYPLGMNRRKKLSDFLIDAKVPLWAKSRVWVLCSGEEIVWVVGHRISERFKIWPHSSAGYQLKKREDALNLEY